jgi:hypothetical protein
MTLKGPSSTGGRKKLPRAQVPDDSLGYRAPDDEVFYLRLAVAGLRWIKSGPRLPPKSKGLAVAS